MSVQEQILQLQQSLEQLLANQASMVSQIESYEKHVNEMEQEIAFKKGMLEDAKREHDITAVTRFISEMEVLEEELRMIQ
jgi:cell division protein FtsB